MDMCGRPRGGGRSATRGSARGGADTAEALTTLTAMGFTPRKARGALQVGMGAWLLVCAMYGMSGGALG